jgi:hypothetical protein
VLGGLALAVVLFGGMAGLSSPVDAQFPEDVAAAMRAERQQLMTSDAWRSLIFCAVAFWLLWFFVAGKVKKGWTVAALAVLVCADLIPVNFRFLPYDSFVSKRETQVRPSKADLQVMADSTPGYRVANMTVSTFNDATTSLFHRSVGGYHGAKLQRYQDLIDRYLSAGNPEIYDMLNTRWYITPGEGGAPQAMLNPDANGAAWFVRDVKMVDTPDAEIDELGKIDTKTTAVVDRRFDEAKAALNIPVDTAAVIELTEYRVNRLTYKYNSAVPQMAVFSEIYYPDGWTATIDGQPLDYFRADYVLRAAMLPAGEHEVVFSFRIPHFAALSAVTLGSTILILLLLGAAIYVTGFKCKKHEQGE